MKTIALAVIVAATGFAQEPAAPKRTLLKYTPPKTAGTGVRTDGDGGSRAGGAKLPSLYVLAPDHTALTTQAQPSLFWFQDGPAPKDVGARFELTLVDPKNPKPLLKVGAPLADQKADGTGIHRIQLARHKITLDPGVAYKWSVALVPDANNRSQDLVASGVIQRSEPSPELTADLAKSDKASAYAANGVWYDALSALSDQIDAAPKDAALRAERAGLLQQAGLKAAAEFERKK
jgi:hypothetical protein